MQTHSHETFRTLPDLGTLWTSERHGLMMITRIEDYATTGFGEVIYTFHVYRVKDSFNTTGIFTTRDWYATFTHVA